MHSTTFRRQGALALLAGAAVLLAALLIAPRAEAATIYACQKKKGGTVRIVASKTKCKKTEKKLKWSTTGTAGKNGSSGTNGTNGANGANGTNGTSGAAGAPGQPQKAVSIDIASDIGGFLSNIYTPVLTLGDVSVRMACGNFVANILGIEATAPSGTKSQTGLIATRIDNTATENQQTQVQTDNPVTNTSIGVLITNTTGELTNKAAFTATITSPTQVVWLHGYMQVGPSGPTACQFRGSAFAIPL